MDAQSEAIAGAFLDASRLAGHGRLDQAESICREILQRQPAHSAALLLRGAIELQTGRTAQGAASIFGSIQCNPSQPGAYTLLGEALLDLNRPQEALRNYEAALEMDSRLVPAHLGRGNALLDLQRPAEALASYDEVLHIQPNHAVALFNRGNALSSLKRYDAAIESYGLAIAANPAYTAAHNNLGGVLKSLHEPERALASFDAAIAIDANFVEAWNNRGVVLNELRRPAEALQAFDCVLRLRPEMPEAHIGRGGALRALNRSIEAIDSYERALAVRSGDGEAMRCLAETLLFVGQPDQAARCYAGLLKSGPAFDFVAGALLHAQQQCADWSTRAPAASYENVHRAVLEGRRADLPFSFLAVSDSAAAQLQCARTFMADVSVAAGPRRTDRSYGHDRLRIAYVSADFRQHAVSHLLAGLFERHDRRRFEIIAISLRPEEASPMGERIKRAFCRFVDVSGHTDEAVAQLMRDMEIDIAVDLVGLTNGQRPKILARRPAPIQVNYLGFPGTSGASFIDYIIADAFVVPSECRRFYAEKVVYLPDCFQANDDRREITDKLMTRREAGLAQDSFVFCCFNNTYKINPTIFTLWMRLLQKAAGSVLWLIGSTDIARDNLRREAANRGVDPQRLVFAPRWPYAGHLARLSVADLFLDTLPFNAGTIGSDALWAGLPMLTCAGQAFAARMGGSLLRAAGLPELITYGFEEYETKALELAENPLQLQELRERLTENRRRLPLFDTDRFRRHLELAYEKMLEIHAGGGEPASFAVRPQQHYG
jgi:protein O-GlcNAc transferase